jgi:hypothetical protein
LDFSADDLTVLVGEIFREVGRLSDHTFQITDYDWSSNLIGLAVGVGTGTSHILVDRAILYLVSPNSNAR